MAMFTSHSRNNAVAGQPFARPAWRWSYLFLAVMVVVQLLPFYLTLNTAMKPATDLSSTLTPRLHDVAWSNWATAISDGKIFSAILNSIIVTVIATAIVCLLGSMAAYPLARHKTAFNKGIRLFVMIMMMVPPLSILVPLYSLLVDMGGANTYWGEIVVMTATHLPLAIFLYSSFIESIPDAIDEAGMIDGAGRLTIFFRLILPTLKPVTATVIIMSGTSIWNDYALSSYILTDPDMQTIAPRVASFFSQNSNAMGVAASASLIAAAPIVILYVFLQRYFIEGMVAGSVK